MYERHQWVDSNLSLVNCRSFNVWIYRIMQVLLYFGHDVIPV
jgi:hypothetical protein